MGQWISVTVIAQINTCSSSGAHSPKTLLAGSAVFLGQGKRWPLLIKETNYRGDFFTQGLFGLSQSSDHVPDAWNGLKAAPTLLLCTLISDSLKKMLHFIIVPLLNRLNKRAAVNRKFLSANVTFKVRWNTLPFYRSHQVFMGILATRVKFFLRLQEVSRARGD